MFAKRQFSLLKKPQTIRKAAAVLLVFEMTVFQALLSLMACLNLVTQFNSYLESYHWNEGQLRIIIIFC